MNTIPEEVLGELQRRSEHQLLELFREGARSWPEDPGILSSLGQILTQLGRHDEGLRIDERLVELCPDDPITHYNLACSLSLLGRTEDALRALEGAVQRGYTDFTYLKADPDLHNVRGDPRFAARLSHWERAR